MASDGTDFPTSLEGDERYQQQEQQQHQQQQPEEERNNIQEVPSQEPAPQHIGGEDSG
jgi:hypothetical protein